MIAKIKTNTNYIGLEKSIDEEMLQEIKSDKNYHILEILTKESYMANCYRVGGEDE